MPVSEVRILVVEDSAADARLIQEAFSEEAVTQTALHHYRLVHVKRLSDAKTLLSTEAFDVILLDLTLPDSDGLATVETTVRYAPHIPIVVMTMRDDESSAQDAMHAGAQDYIAKRRMDGTTLIRSVRYAMERKRFEKQRIELAAAHAVRVEAENAATRIRRLQTITDSVLEQLSHVEVIDNLLRRIAEVLCTDRAAILLTNSAGTEFVPALTRSVPAVVAASMEERLINAFGARVADGRQCLVLIAGDTRDALHPLFEPDGICCLAGSPMMVRGKLTGVLLIGGLRREFAEEDVRLLQLIAERIGFVVDHARLYEDERKAKEEAEIVGRMKDEFLATMSHELRTPLTAIVGWARVLGAPGISPAMLAKGVEVIQRNSLAQSALIDDLLDVSRIIAGNLRLNVQPLDISSIIEDAISAARPTAEVKGVHLKRITNRNSEMIAGDVNRLQQVLSNLLANAIKFTAKGGSVEVASQRADSQLEITVSDTGEGIDADFLPFVFERFRQARSVNNRQHGGLGIGLSVVKHIVEQHGGTVRAESKGLNQGARFIVRLPISAVRSQGTTADQRQPAEMSLENVHILIVDDELDTRSMLEVVFAQCKAKVTTAASGEEGLRAIAETNPDILISDIGMAGMNGYELIASVRASANSSARPLPSIALTAFSQPEDRRKCLAAGFDVHVAKPVDPLGLIALVRQLTKAAHPSGDAAATAPSAAAEP